MTGLPRGQRAEAAREAARLLAAQDSQVKVLYNGDCRGCGECCSRFLPVSQRDLERLRRHVCAHGIETVPERAEIDLLCPFLSDGRICAVYEARPDICRAYRCDRHAFEGAASVGRVMIFGPYEIRDLREEAELWAAEP